MCNEQDHCTHLAWRLQKHDKLRTVSTAAYGGTIIGKIAEHAFIFRFGLNKHCRVVHAKADMMLPGMLPTHMLLSKRHVASMLHFMHMVYHRHADCYEISQK